MSDSTRARQSLLLMNGSLTDELEIHGSEAVKKDRYCCVNRWRSTETFPFSLAKSSDGMGDFFLYQFCP